MTAVHAQRPAHVCAAVRTPMLAAVLASGLALGCAESEGVTVVRISDELTLRTPVAVLTATLDPESGAITAEIAVVAETGQAGAVPISDPAIGGGFELRPAAQLALRPGPLGWKTPAGQLVGPELAAPLDLKAMANGAPAWTGSLDGTPYQLWVPAERAALADALAASGLATPLRTVLPYHRHVRAWMAEAAAVFAVAALAEPTTTLEPSSWPAITTADQLDPPGKLAGDSPGLGMTCSTEIRCPPDAPICVTATHEQHYGFCTRACLEHAECERGRGQCGLAVTDIPGVPDGMTTCYLTCAGDGSCPGLLRCTAEFNGQAGVCAPP